MFPVVGRSGVAFETIHVERLPVLDRNERFATAPGVADAIEILMDARADDAASTRLDGISVVASGRGFGGKSYGLALAIADKRARKIGSPNTPLIATGRILERERGRIGAIEGFDVKAEAVLTRATEESELLDFAFPAENWKALEATLRQRLLDAQRAGRLRLWPGDSMEDLATLWQVPNPTRRRRSVLAMAAVVSLVAATGAAWQYWQGADSRACRSTERALGASHDDARIAAAIAQCRAALARDPNDPHLHFLLGKALNQGGSPVLAAAEFKAGAVAGDVGAMANYGRYLWQADPTDIVARRGARQWLERAAGKGSVDAARDIGYMLLDDSASRPDPVGAQYWMAKAQAMEAAGNHSDGLTQ